MNKGLLLLLSLLGIIYSLSATPEITLSVAASSIDIMEEVSALYSETHDIKIRLNPGSSGQLAKQIDSGAEPDIYISASKKWIEYISDNAIVIDSFVKNRMVLITFNDSLLEPTDDYSNLPNYFEGRLSIGDPEHVPAGSYAKELLVYFKSYNALKKRIIPAMNVRAALAIVELGECEAGIVYKTDALKSDKVRIIAEFPTESHSTIEYFKALLTENEHAQSFYTFMTESSEAKKIYKRYGFL